MPESAIAQVPADRRENSRLLVIDRSTRSVAHHWFHELPRLLPQRFSFYRNNVSVIKARLLAERATGGKVECLLLYPKAGDPESSSWQCLLRPGRKLPVGATFSRPGYFTAKVVEKREDGSALCTFSHPGYKSLVELTADCGEVPLPPYIRRKPGDERAQLDQERYQTVYADPKQPFAVAAPTAGLHFTPDIEAHLKAQGHELLDLTLHVGLGTFRPIDTETVEAFQIHRELYEIPPATLASLGEKKERHRLAIGTTSLRTIEDYQLKRDSEQVNQQDTPGFVGEAEIFVYPPRRFYTDALITNFHLPKSSLLCLVSAFLTPGSTEGIDWLKDLYAEALKHNYRFYSYGDAMLIL